MTFPTGWYAIALSSQLKRNKPLGLRRFGQNLVAWRNENATVVAMLDCCPHRKAKLSLGAIKNNCLVCPYHGLEFNELGHCTLVPEANAPAPNVCVETFQVIEHNNIIWLWWSNSVNKPKFQPQWFSELESKDFAVCGFSKLWHVNITRAIENQLDYAHLPYVHKRSIGRGISANNEQEVSCLGGDIPIIQSGPKSGKALLEYRFPNIWLLSISSALKLTVLFVPIENDQTLLYVQAHQKMVTLPLLREILHLTLNVANRKILSEDERVVSSQGTESSLSNDNEALFASDKGIRYFRKIWAERGDS